MMLDGLDSVCDHFIGIAIRTRRPGSLAIVVHHLLGDLANAMEYALTHHFPLRLTEPFLQGSSFGTPYQKWAKFTHDNFHEVDRALQRLLPAVWAAYEEASAPSESDLPYTTPEGWMWFANVHDYVCCAVDPDEPMLTLSAVHLKGWADPASGLFLGPRPEDHDWNAPIITRTRHDISDRTVITALQRTGLARLVDLRRQIDQFAEWLRTHATMEGITAPHRGTLSQSFG